MKIYLIRHGETFWNQKKRLQGHSDIPLNEKGKETAKATRQFTDTIPFDIIYSSPLIRAKQTAYILMKGRNVPAKTDARLKEICFGKAEGKSIKRNKNNPFSRIYNFFHHPEKYIPPKGGESLEEAKLRCKDFIETELIPNEDVYENVLITAHGAIIRAFLAYVDGRDLSRFWGEKPLRNCEVSVVELQDGKLSLVSEGDIYYEIGE